MVTSKLAFIGSFPDLRVVLGESSISVNHPGIINLKHSSDEPINTIMLKEDSPMHQCKLYTGKAIEITPLLKVDAYVHCQYCKKNCKNITNYISSKKKLKVISFNLGIEKYENLSMVREHLELYGIPDFILMQEIMVTKELSLVRQLAKLMGLAFVHFPRKKGSEGIGILSQYPLSQDSISQNFELTTNDKFVRIAQIVDFDTVGLGVVRIVNTHLAHKVDKGDIRKSQTGEIILKIDEVENHNKSVVTIFGGDFNANKNESRYKGELDFATIFDTDSLDAITGHDHRYNFLDLNGSNFTTDDSRRIDHIFYKLSSHIRIKYFKERVIDNSFLPVISDHRALLHEIEFIKDKTNIN